MAAGRNPRQRGAERQTQVLYSFSVGSLAPPLLSGLERRLLVCRRCLERLSAIEPCSFVHYTGDGPFYSRVTLLRTGMLFARHWGRSLEGGRRFRTHEAAKTGLNAVLPSMTPGSWYLSPLLDPAG